ncbi:MAG: restriction endonuclease subunit S, partial [Acetobacterium sp.]|nr:restriction endonuclease subunit S [Acetobacterium sp.]
MSEKKKKVPQLRFPGFSGEWEERKVLDVAPLQRGFDLPKIEMQEGDYPVVMSNGINGYHSDYKAKAPGVVTGRSGTLGNLHYIELNYWPHNTALWVTDFKGNEPLYIFYMYQKLDLIRFGTGSGVPTLNRNDVHATKIYMPNLEEQEKISSFLRKCDHLITLQQRQLTHLQTRKKGLLQKMFPKDGELFPELRFPGFRDAWEMRKLNDISEKVTEKNKNREFTETLTNSAEYGILSQNDYFEKEISNEKNIDGYYVVRSDDFVYNPRISNYAPVGPIKRNKLN